MVARKSQPSPREICERGDQIYAERLRSILEPEHNGKFVVIDIDTGEYELDANHRAASDRAFAKRPNPTLYAVRVGYPTVGRLGARARVSPE